jgi:apolipoprotein N-acyltransferase
MSDSKVKALSHQNTFSSRSGCHEFDRLDRLLLTSASAILLTLSQSPIGMGFLAPIALVPWLFATRRAGSIEAVLLGLLLGLAHGLSAAGWIASAFESQGAHGTRGVFATLVTVLWAKGILYAAMGGVVQRLRTAPIAAQVALPAFAFGLAEAWICGARSGLPLLLLGYSQESVPGVAQLTIVAGAPGVSALLLGINCALASFDGRATRTVILASALVAAWLATAGIGMPYARALRPPVESPANDRSALLIQPAIPRSSRWDPAFQGVILDDVARYTAAALEATNPKPDVILWPENLLTSPVDERSELGRRLHAYVDRWNGSLVTGLVRDAETKRPGLYRNSVVWWRPDVGLVDAIDKVRAIPFIESNRDFWGRGILSRWLGEASRGPRVLEAADTRPLRGDFTLTPVLCFEVLFPDIVADRRDKESLAIINLADDSWVEGEIVDAQLITAAAFRAIEERLMLVRVSHGGLSVAVDQFGLQFAALPPDEYGSLVISLVATPPPTAVERLALLALPVTAGVLTGWFAWAVMRNRDSNHHA